MPILELGPQGLPQWSKDPGANKDYTIDWTEWLNGDTVSASTWSVPSGLTKGSSSLTTLMTTVWLSGGVAGKTYRVTNTIVTAGGRTEVRSFEIAVRPQ